MHPRIAPNSVRSVDICIALSDTFYVVLVRGQLHAPFDLPRFNRISICSYFLNYFRENLFCCIFICFYFRLQKISYEPHSIKRHGENGSSRRASLLPRTVRLPHRSHCVPLDINRCGFKVFLWSCWADSNCRPHPYQLPQSLPAPAVQGFSAIFCPKRKRSQPVYSIVSVHVFPRVGHGVGQADTSASKKPRTGFAVIFRFAVSLS